MYRPKQDEYIARRRTEYPDISDQVGLIMDYLKSQKDVGPDLLQMINKIDEVKVKWPKSNGDI